MTHSLFVYLFLVFDREGLSKKIVCLPFIYIYIFNIATTTPGKEDSARELGGLGIRR